MCAGKGLFAYKKHLNELKPDSQLENILLICGVFTRIVKYGRNANNSHSTFLSDENETIILNEKLFDTQIFIIEYKT